MLVFTGSDGFSRPSLAESDGFYRPSPAVGDGFYRPSLSASDGLEKPSLPVKTSIVSRLLFLEPTVFQKLKAVCKVTALRCWEINNYQWILVKNLIYNPLKTFFLPSSSLCLSRICDNVVQ